MRRIKKEKGWIIKEINFINGYLNNHSNKC